MMICKTCQASSGSTHRDTCKAHTGFVLDEECVDFPARLLKPATMKSPKGSMNIDEFNVVVQATIESIQKLLAVKGGEYAGATTDRLAAFKRSGDLAGVAPLQCLMIYMAKHYDAVATFVRDEASGTQRERSEPIDGRLDDIINYCILAKAIIQSNR